MSKKIRQDITEDLLEYEKQKVMEWVRKNREMEKMTDKESKYNEECKENCVVHRLARIIPVCFVQRVGILHTSKMTLLVNPMKRLKQYGKK